MSASGVELRSAPGRAVVRTLAVVAAVPFVHAGVMAVAGFGFVLDDWYTLRNAHFDGAFAAAGGDQLLARPGAWIVYGVVFGLVDGTPLVILGLLATIRAGTAVALWFLLRRFVDDVVALAVTAVWVFLPGTSSLEFWASGSNISLALLAAVGGCLAFARRLEGSTRIGVAAGLLAGATVLYEAVVPVAAVTIAGIAIHHHRSDLRSAARSVVVPLGAMVAASVWLVANWNPAKTPSRSFTDFSPAVGAHVGWGVVGNNGLAALSSAALLAVVMWSVATVAAPNVVRPAGLAEKLVLAGTATVLLSLVPFAAYAYEPQGIGDRVNVTASIGTAMIWTGAGLFLWHRQKQITVGLAVLALVAMSAVRARLIDAYSWAASEADRIVASVPCSIDGDSPVIAGPRPEVRRNITSFLDADDHLEPAVQIATGRPHLQVRVVLDEVDLARRGGADVSLTDPRPCTP